MKNFIKNSALLLASMALFACFSVTSCSWLSDSKEKTDKDSTQVKNYVDLLMKQYYYWADQMPAVTAKGKSINDYFTSKLVSKDRWSWMMNGESFRSMETGISTSYGFHIAQPIEYFGDYDVYITYVDNNSPLAKAGITRGCRLTHIAGTDVATLIKNETFYTQISKSSNTFRFTDTKGVSKDVNLSQASFQSNSVSLSKTFTKTDAEALNPTDKVGYILYTTFNNNMKNEIMSTLQSLKNEGITDLILDLRYNGGGDLELCNDIANILAPASADGGVFIKLSHNQANKSQDKDYIITRTANSLDLSRLFIITGSGTASASECLINCLAPYMDIHTVGGQTYGKPNGMYVFLYPNNASTKTAEYAFLPTCFYCNNSEGKADYDNGITPEQKRYDDLYHNFTPDEDLIKACLAYIATGTYPALPAKSATKTSSKNNKQLNISQEFKGAYIKNRASEKVFCNLFGQ